MTSTDLNVPERLVFFGSRTITTHRYSNPQLSEDRVAGWMIEQVNFADNGTYLGVLWAHKDGTWTVVDRSERPAGVRFDGYQPAIEALLMARPGPPARGPARVRVRVVIEYETELLDDPTAWEGEISKEGRARKEAEYIREDPNYLIDTMDYWDRVAQVEVTVLP